MSSETSTDKASVKTEAGLQPWQLFVLAGLGCATAITFLVRDRGVLTVVPLTIIMATAVLVGLGSLRVLRPLLSPQDDRGAALGRRTRALLEQEKNLALRTIKELEFDHAMGKVSQEDFDDMARRLRVRAGRLIRQLDAGDGYRAQIERDVAKRLGDVAAKDGPVTCTACAVSNDKDAKFCKACGERL